MTSAFVLAQKLVQARDLEEMLKLQADYVRSQIDALTEQARDMSKLTDRGVPCGSAKRDALVFLPRNVRFRG